MRVVSLQALQNLKHRHGLHKKAWRHLHVKKHEADMICSEARLRRSELFSEADTSAHPAVEPTTDDEGIDDFALPAETFLRTARQVRRLPRVSLSSRQLMQRMRQSPPQRHPGIQATEQNGTGVHSAAGRRSAHQAATCVRQESRTLIHRTVCVDIEKMTLHDTGGIF